MIQFFQQFVGESRDYQQSIAGDKIVDVEWSCGAGGTVAVIDAGIGKSSTVGRLTTGKAGRMKLRASITTDSGQVVVGEATIIVLS